MMFDFAYGYDCNKKNKHYLYCLVLVRNGCNNTHHSWHIFTLMPVMFTSDWRSGGGGHHVFQGIPKNTH